jgi:NAD kinase
VGRVVVDGQVSCQFDATARVVVREADRPFVFIRLGLVSYYSRLRQILGWGGGPRYAS